MMHSLAYTIVLASVVVALPQKARLRAEDPGLAATPATKGINRIFVANSCNEAEQNHIKQAFNDAQLLANALNTWEPAGKNQDVMNTYMGTDSSSQGDPTMPGSNYREIIQNNIIREATLYGPPTVADNQLYIMCNEDQYWPNKTEAKCNPENDWAWTWNNPGTARVDHYMTYCPNYFNKLPTLADDVDKAQKDKNAIKSLNDFASNKASAFFHETLHMDKTVGDPPIGDKDGNNDVYGPTAVADTAATRNAATSMLIADSYTMAGLAIYYRDLLELTDFPRPGDKASDIIVTGKKLDNPGIVQAATDPNDPNSTPSGDWIPLVGA